MYECPYGPLVLLIATPMPILMLKANQREIFSANCGVWQHVALIRGDRFASMRLSAHVVV